MKKVGFGSLFFLLINSIASAQVKPLTDWVDPFIGTARSDQFTRWGNEGGTYPGAVAPWSRFQLSPETGPNGYEYADSTIAYFTCFGHHSGFPSGSTGRFRLMPAIDTNTIPSLRPFSHRSEKASPGYYRVSLADNQTVVEATGTTFGGLFRFLFPDNSQKALFLPQPGEWQQADSVTLTFHTAHTVLRFNQPVQVRQKNGGLMLWLGKAAAGDSLLIRLSNSGINTRQSLNNVATLQQPFDSIAAATRRNWETALNVVHISDNDSIGKTIFYTALYHSLLLPWIVSDADGQYLGQDRQPHLTRSRYQYGGFSPWDTFRSLHPLLTWWYPDRQNDMLRSMMDQYLQGGFLPTESMTGNHSIPIVVDSYRKGLRPDDSLVLFRAMKKSIVDTPAPQADFPLYREGFIPYPHSESVTRTIEYAYDDWALSTFSRFVVEDQAAANALENRSRSYRNLFDLQTRLFQPRAGNVFLRDLANAGYKEGDTWVYSLFLPQYPRDLINLSGGDAVFVQRLDESLQNRRIVFDNETMFHVPYLFNATAYPYKTQDWIQQIRNSFSAKPGGLPGNDDLGSLSSWYVFTAIGFYPICPGNPVYAVGLPQFREVTIQVPGQTPVVITRADNNRYPTKLLHHEKEQSTRWISHQQLAAGGKWLFQSQSKPESSYPVVNLPGDDDEPISCQLSDVLVEETSVTADQLFQVHFTLTNSGGSGTYVVQLFNNDSLVQEKNLYIRQFETLNDSISCRLYQYGSNRLRIGQEPPISVLVQPSRNEKNQPYLVQLRLPTLHAVKKTVPVQYSIQNRSGQKRIHIIPLVLDGKIIYRDTLILQPGATVTASYALPPQNAGWHWLSVLDKNFRFKSAASPADALVVNLRGQLLNQSLVKDASGFNNDAVKAPFGRYLALPHSNSLDSLDKQLTLSVWVFDSGPTMPSTTLLAQGDHNVLQINNGRELDFFAGGWGRGECVADLPADWKNKWHQVTAVCNDRNLRLYIDGKLVKEINVKDATDLRAGAAWTIGSNEEFPLERTFTGQLRDVSIYRSALPPQP